MALYHVKKMDAYGGSYSAIVRAKTIEEALARVSLTPADLQELNEPYVEEPYPRYSISVEKVRFVDGVYSI